MVEHWDQLIDFAQFYDMSNPLRGLVVRRWLIEAVYVETEAQGCGFVRWIARNYNYQASGLCGKLAEKTDLVLCGMIEVATK